MQRLLTSLVTYQLDTAFQNLQVRVLVFFCIGSDAVTRPHATLQLMPPLTQSKPTRKRRQRIYHWESMFKRLFMLDRLVSCQTTNTPNPQRRREGKLVSSCKVEFLFHHCLEAISYYYKYVLFLPRITVTKALIVYILLTV